MEPASETPAAGERMPTVGAIVSLRTVTVTGSDVQRSPRRSRATARSACDPLLASLVFQAIAYGAVVSAAPRSAPSRVNWTSRTVSRPTTVTLALTTTVPPTVEPGAGSDMVTINFDTCATAG